LQEIRAATRFVCFEPLLGSIGTLSLEGLDWAIASGESGPGARPLNPDWAREIRDACIAADVPFFFKQWGGTRTKLNGNLLDGRTWEQYPAQLLRSR
jgi:protein gp37